MSICLDLMPEFLSKQFSAHNNMIEAASMENASLLGLPTEIRELIYQKVVQSWREMEPSGYPELLRTCQQIQAEAASILYAELKCFTSTTSMISCLDSVGSKNAGLFRDVMFFQPIDCLKESDLPECLIRAPGLKHFRFGLHMHKCAKPREDRIGRIYESLKLGLDQHPRLSKAVSRNPYGHNSKGSYLSVKFLADDVAVSDGEAEFSIEEAVANFLKQ